MPYAGQIAGVEAAISGNAFKNNGCTVFTPGTVTLSTAEALVTNTFGITEDIAGDYQYGSKVINSTYPNLSGVTTTAAIAGRRFAGMLAGYYVGTVITSQIAGVADTFLRSASSEGIHRRFPYPISGTRLLDEDSWDYVTGAVTKGGNEGTFQAYHLPSGAGFWDDAAHSHSAVPGELTYMVNGVLPTNDEYAARTLFGRTRQGSTT